MFSSLSIRSALAIVFAASLATISRAADNDFHPELVGVELTAREIRPGDPVALAIKFRNAGPRPAQADYKVFVHLEPEPNDREIVFQADHSPDTPTSLWQTGQTILDGPHLLTIPATLAPGEYCLHIGVFSPEGGGPRFLDSYAGGKLTISPRAQPADQLGPPKLPAGDAEKRRAALAARISAKQAAVLETDDWRFSLDRGSAAWALTDKASSVLWTSDPRQPRFGEILLRSGERSAIWPIDRFDEIAATPNRLRLVTRPLVNGQPSGASVTFTIEPVAQPGGMRIAYTAPTDGPWKVARVSLLDHACLVTEEDAGKFYVAHRLGIERPASKAFPGVEQWRTYDQLSMAMCGAVKQGSALLVNWDQVDTRLRLQGEWPDSPLIAGRRACSLTLDIEGPEGSCSLHPLGRGDYVQIAQAYRKLAKAKGWLTTWAEKREIDPSVERFYGASNFKPFVFNRILPSSRYSPDHREHTHLGYTFDEVASCAEHWRNDLKIDRAAVVLAGWINRGYDVGHPDVLPAAPECGGDERLAEAGRRIKACGYFFGLHDNYLDMYEDAPSWGKEWLAKDAHGEPKRGGNWAGGQAWRVCAIKQVELANRTKTNLPEIARRFQPTAYFIDTVFAEDLVTCEDPSHLTDRLGDLRWKTRLCELAKKKYFGPFGSEEGREWAVPCAEYFEGIFSHQTESATGDVIPLFPLVFSDCVQLMTHQGNRVGPGDEKKIADHILFAEMPLPSFGPHCYWPHEISNDPEVKPLAPEVQDLGGRRFAITYRWQVGKPLPWDGSIFVHFLQAGQKKNDGMVFQHDHAPRTATSEWKAGIQTDGPYAIQLPAGITGPVEIGVGMLHDGQRVSLEASTQDDRRYRIGTLIVDDQKIGYQPGSSADTAIWSRGDGGWAAPLGAHDRVIKNSWEALSPLNVITAERPLSSHEFLTTDRRLQRTRFGDLTITVAYDQPARVGDHAIPAFGFIVESPGFVAFCATRYNGVDYESPTFFTVRSLDGKPISQSKQVRIYHGFGDPKIKLFGKEFSVQREEVVQF